MLTAAFSFCKTSRGPLLLLILVFTTWNGVGADPRLLLERARGITSATNTHPPGGLTNVLAVPTNAPAAGAVGTDADDKIRLGIGDRLSFRILEDQDEPKSLIVTDSGDIEVPYIGRVKGLGRTCRELQGEMKTRLENDYYHHATVLLALDQFNRSRGKVYIAGYVKLAGPQDVPTDEVFTLSKAIMRAGGFTDFSDKRRVRVTRAKAAIDAPETVLQVDVGAIIEEGRQERDIRLEAGDSVYVPSRLFKF